MSVPELSVLTIRPSSSRRNVVRHSISRSSPDLVTIGVLDDGIISAVHAVLSFCLVCVPYPGRHARLDEVAPEQLVGCPSEDAAGVAIDQRDPPFHVQREQDDFGRVQVSLRPVPLACLRQLASEVAVLVNAADLPRERHDQVLHRPR